MRAYKKIESWFEQMSNVVFRLLGNWLVFIAALMLIIFWFSEHDWHAENLTDAIRDFITAITFLALFIIQKTFIHFSQAINLKLNELVISQEKARNHVIKAEEKSSEEIAELSKAHDEIIEQERQEK